VEDIGGNLGLPDEINKESKLVDLVVPDADLDMFGTEAGGRGGDIEGKKITEGNGSADASLKVEGLAM
jgi:hypothetical protein